VQPLALVYRWGNWNLSAYDLEKEDYRTFRVSRIKQSEGDLKELPGVKRRDLPDEKKAVLKLLATQPWNMGEGPEVQVKVDFAGEESERAQRMFGDSATVERAEGGKVRMVICARNLEVLASRLFRFGSGAEIISPQEAREAAASLLRRMVVSEKGGKRRC